MRHVPRKHLFFVALAAAAACAVSACGGSSHRASPTSTPGRASAPAGSGGNPVATGDATGADTRTVSPQPAGSINVTAAPYDADRSGSGDASGAIEAAITAAEQAPHDGVHNVVYFPSGTYALDRHSGGYAFTITAPVVIEGAGAGSTQLIQMQGAAAPTNRVEGQGIFRVLASKTSPTTPGGGGDGTVIEGLTLNSQAHDGGTTVLDEANDTTLDNLVILAPRSSHGKGSYNRDQFGVRTIVACNKHTFGTVYRLNNTVENLTLNGRGSAGNTDLDVSCEDNERVTNINDVGNGMDIYQAGSATRGGVTVTDITTRPGTFEKTPFSIVVTGPSIGVKISDFRTYGSGGKFQAIEANSGTITDSSITDEQMIDTPAGKVNALTIGDVDGLTITDSRLTAVVVAPNLSATAITFQATTVAGHSYPYPAGSVTCTHAAKVSQVAGLNLPATCLAST